jgi:hypothetical protein
LLIGETLNLSATDARLDNRPINQMTAQPVFP